MSGGSSLQNIAGDIASSVGNFKAPQSGTPGRPFPVAKFTPRGPGYANPGGTGVGQSIKGAEQKVQQGLAPQGDQNFDVNRPLTGNFQPSWMNRQPAQPPMVKGQMPTGPGQIQNRLQPMPVPGSTPRPTPDQLSTPGPVASTPQPGGFTPPSDWTLTPFGAGKQMITPSWGSAYYKDSQGREYNKDGTPFTGGRPINMLPIDQQGNVLGTNQPATGPVKPQVGFGAGFDPATGEYFT